MLAAGGGGGGDDELCELELSGWFCCLPGRGIFGRGERRASEAGGVCGDGELSGEENEEDGEGEGRSICGEGGWGWSNI